MTDAQKASQETEVARYGEEEPQTEWRDPDRMISIGEWLEKGRNMAETCWRKRYKTIGWTVLLAFIIGPLLYTLIRWKG
jgi:hypothetical protein